MQYSLRSLPRSSGGCSWWYSIHNERNLCSGVAPHTSLLHVALRWVNQTWTLLRPLSLRPCCAIGEHLERPESIRHETLEDWTEYLRIPSGWLLESLGEIALSDGVSLQLSSGILCLDWTTLERYRNNEKGMRGVFSYILIVTATSSSCRQICSRTATDRYDPQIMVRNSLRSLWWPNRCIFCQIFWTRICAALLRSLFNGCLGEAEFFGTRLYSR